MRFRGFFEDKVIVVIVWVWYWLGWRIGVLGRGDKISVFLFWFFVYLVRFVWLIRFRFLDLMIGGFEGFG